MNTNFYVGTNTNHSTENLLNPKNNLLTCQTEITKKTKRILYNFTLFHFHNDIVSILILWSFKKWELPFE